MGSPLSADERNSQQRAEAESDEAGIALARRESLPDLRKMWHILVHVLCKHLIQLDKSSDLESRSPSQTSDIPEILSHRRVPRSRSRGCAATPRHLLPRRRLTQDGRRCPQPLTPFQAKWPVLPAPAPAAGASRRKQSATALNPLRCQGGPALRSLRTSPKCQDLTSRTPVDLGGGRSLKPPAPSRSAPDLAGTATGLVGFLQSRPCWSASCRSTQSSP